MSKVSIIMAARNVEKYILAAIISCSNQSFTDWELLIGNDASTDDTLKVIQGTIGDFLKDRITVVNLAWQMGQAHVRNTLIAQSSGEYLAILDADDTMDWKRLEKQVAYLDEYLHTAAVGNWATLVNADGNKHLGTKKKPVCGDALEFYSLFMSPMVHSTTMIRRTVFDEVGGYDVDKKVADDFFLLSKIGAYRLANMQEVLGDYRVHSGSLTGRGDYNGFDEVYAVAIWNIRTYEFQKYFSDTAIRRMTNLVHGKNMTVRETLSALWDYKTLVSAWELSCGISHMQKYKKLRNSYLKSLIRFHPN